jgi:hypothetical protein
VRHVRPASNPLRAAAAFAAVIMGFYYFPFTRTFLLGCYDRLIVKVHHAVPTRLASDFWISLLTDEDSKVLDLAHWSLVLAAFSFLGRRLRFRWLLPCAVVVIFSTALAHRYALIRCGIAQYFWPMPSTEPAKPDPEFVSQVLTSTIVAHGILLVGMVIFVWRENRDSA